MKLNYKQSIIGGAIALGGATGLMGFNESLEKYSLPFMVLGLGLLGFGIYQIKKKKSIVMKLILTSTITCPKCGLQKEETMPTDACQFFYECEQCKEILKPKKGDCCVYCSYGTVACPPIQEGKACC